MKKLTIIITALNEGNEPLETIKSIYATAPMDEIDIILFNDASENWRRIPKEYKEVTTIRNYEQLGAPANYDKGVEIAKTRYVAIFNSRMRFYKNWYEKVMKVLVDSKETLFCTTSGVLEDGKIVKKLYGAEILEKTKDDIFVPKWLPAENKSVYDIPCVLGANYFTSKIWYQTIGGFQGLSIYGGMCAYISLKSWVMGGKCQIIRGVTIGNKYREFKDKVAQKPYLDNMVAYWYNKVFTAFVFFDNKKAIELMDVLFHSEYYTLVQRLIMKNIDNIYKTKNRIKIINNVNNYIRRK